MSTTGHAVAGGRASAPPSALPTEILEASPLPLLTSKLRPPPARRGLVERTAILERIDAAADMTVLAVVAPAGYGKSTLLRQWVDRNDRPSTWLSLDADDNDPTVLLGHVAAALGAVTPIDAQTFDDLVVEYPSVHSIGRRLADALGTSQGDVVLVIDDVHALTNPTCHDLLTLLVGQATPTVSVAMASREELPVPISHMRARGGLVEVSPRELAMDPNEATSVVERAGRSITDDVARELVVETEGWPVALYLLAGLGGEAGSAVTAPSGTGRRRSVIDYVREEFLSGLDDEDVHFLVRSSVLERMTGPSCDAVLEMVGSGERLERYCRSNLLVIPLDDERTAYRYHHMFHDLLRAELESREPELVPQLLGRAAAWNETHGHLDDAVEYAMAAGDVDRAARIVADHGLTLYRTGRSTTLERWFDWFEQGGHMANHPGIASAAAWMAALTGHPGAAGRRAAAAEAARPRRPDDDPGDEVDALVDLMRATLCLEGIPRALEDVTRAVGSLPAGHPWRAPMLTMTGVVHACAGHVDEADRILADAADLAGDSGAVPAQSVALAERALLAVERGDAHAARRHATAGLVVVEQPRMQDHATNVLVLGVAARVAGASGDAARTADLVARAQRLRPRLNHAMPHLAVQARLALARALLTLGDGAGARVLVREIDEILRSRPGLGTLQQEVESFRPHLDTAPSVAPGASTLTAAELRVLPLLQTHLTFREIGERLFLSPNTIKTQAISAYRKLGVSSRSQAVDRAVEIGLLET